MHLFLYGTLQPASATPMARWLASRIDEAYPATMPGRLLAIAGQGGVFPALVRGGPFERCQGTVIRVALGRGDLARLDRYEGPEYRRVAVRAQIASGALVQVTVYRWRTPAPTGSQIIEDGDFLAWLRRTGRRSYTGPQNFR